MAEPINRRSFLKTSGIIGASLPLATRLHGHWPDATAGDELDVHIFSKQLQFLDAGEAARVAREIGFKGLDLTVRPGGHVEPERVGDDLPRAVEAIRQSGSDCRIITTAVESARRPLDLKLLETAAALGIGFYRCNWFKYPKKGSMEEAIARCSTQLGELSRVNRSLDLVGCYQNHSGIHIGSSFWEVKMILKEADPAYFGSEFDIRHFTVEGANSWQNALRLLHPHIKTIVIKDFRYELQGGKWKQINIPVGEGMVDFHSYFRMLKDYGLKPPVVLHLEYPLGGAEHGSRQINIPEEQVFAAMKKDLEAIQTFWREA